LLIHQAFFDGIIESASDFLFRPALGWIIFIAVFLQQNIPEGFITVSSVMLRSGRPASRAFSWEPPLP